MKTREILFFFVMLIVSLLFLISGCSHPDQPEPDIPDPVPTVNTEDIIPDPPSEVTVLRRDKGLFVAWSAVKGADHYALYRRTGESDFIPVTPDTLQDTYYYDTDYPLEKTVQYTARSVTGNKIFLLSAPSNIVSYYVQDVAATVWQYNDRIVVTWDLHPEMPDS